MKKAPTLQKNGEKQVSSTATAEGTKKKHARAPTTPATTHKHGAKKARRGPQVKEEVDTTTDGRGKKSVDKGEKMVMGVAAEKGVDAAQAGGSHNKPHPPPSSATAVTPKSKLDVKQKLTAAAATMPPPPPPSINRLAEASGMSPSDEILVLKQAREAAKKEAEASGGGRRPRAPSRRALEASGQMKGEGAQWMTKEKRAEQARVMAELRDQRKRNRAAGLKIGVVAEVLMETAEPAAAAAVTGTAVSTDSGDVGGGGGAPVVERAEPVLGDAAWQKVSPALL